MNVLLYILAAVGGFTIIIFLLVAYVAISAKLNKYNELAEQISSLKCDFKKLEKTTNDLEDIVHDVEILNADFEGDHTLVDLYQDLDSRVRQIDRDINGISGLKFDVAVLQGHYGSIAEYSRLILGKKVNNIIEDVTFMKNDYEKRFENLGELSKDYTEKLQSIDDRLDRIEIEKQNNEEKAEWLYENVEEGKND